MGVWESDRGDGGRAAAGQGWNWHISLNYSSIAEHQNDFLLRFDHWSGYDKSPPVVVSIITMVKNASSRQQLGISFGATHLCKRQPSPKREAWN